MMNLNGSYTLRGFEHNNPLDIERMNLMYYHPVVMQAKGYMEPGFNFSKDADLQESHPSMFNILSTISPIIQDVSYAVVDELDKLVGWIWFYIDKGHPLPIGVAEKLGLNYGNSRIYQVSYEKLMSEGWPSELIAKLIHSDHIELHKPRKGVIVEGLRLAINKVVSEYKLLYSSEHKLVLYGYVMPDNIASQIVLERNGFVKETRKYSYNKVMHDLWVKVV